MQKLLVAACIGTVIPRGALAKLAKAEQEWHKACQHALDNHQLDIKQSGIMQAIGEAVVAAAQRKFLSAVCLMRHV